MTFPVFMLVHLEGHFDFVMEKWYINFFIPIPIWMNAFGLNMKIPGPQKRDLKRETDWGKNSWQKRFHFWVTVTSPKTNECPLKKSREDKPSRERTHNISPLDVRKIIFKIAFSRDGLISGSETFPCEMAPFLGEHSLVSGRFKAWEKSPSIWSWEFKVLRPRKK